MKIPKTAKPRNIIAELDEASKYCVQEGTKAWNIRESYASCRTAFDNLRYRRDANYVVPKRYDGLLPTHQGRRILVKGVKSVWLVLDEFFEQNSINPASYIMFQFARTDPGKQPPEPNQLITGPRVEKWYKYQEDLPAQLAATLRAENREFLSKVSYYETFGRRSKVEACLLTIANDDTTLSPLYRYCKAWELLRASGDARFREIINSLEEAAILQFGVHPTAYTAQWTKALPPGLREI